MDPAEVAKKGFSTRVLLPKPDPHSGAVVPPISLSTIFAQKGPEDLYPGGFQYVRTAGPSRTALEAKLATMEGGKYGLVFGSGLAAMASFFSSFDPDIHVICIDDVYGGARRYLAQVPHHHSNTTFVDFATHPEKLEPAFTDKTKVVWVETPTNPTLKITDIEAASAIAHKHGCVVVVDNTFASPYFQSPLELGADVVMHSITKYINGHADVLAGGLVLNDDELYEKLAWTQNALGSGLAQFDSYLVHRGAKTLAVRMEKHQKNAFAVARFLEGHDMVRKVRYPGLESHPQHEVAKKQMKGFGGVLSFWIKGGIPAARAFLETLQVFTLAVSLGTVESLAEHPALMTHASVPADVRPTLGIDDELIRLSVGLEDEKDLIDDLTQALGKAAEVLNKK